MDQINSLSELTHKRRLSAIGSSDLNQDHAGMEVREVHASHYGRIGPIETAKARINDFGFIETPYIVVENVRPTSDIVYLPADKEECRLIAQPNCDINENSNVTGKITLRKFSEILEVDPHDVDLMDVSPKQVISIAAGLISFLEQDDTSHAFIGAAYRVGTGIENNWPTILGM
jgi:DNA-directed RNA polymerase subunit beta